MKKRLSNERASRKQARDTFLSLALAAFLPMSQAGDWNGDIVDTVGLYNPATAKFFLRDNHSGGIADYTVSYGPAGASLRSLIGDWNGDGVDTVGLYAPSSGEFLLIDSHDGGTADLAYRYGPAGAGWIPLAGDWNGDGMSTPGLYDPSAGKFFLRNTHAGGVADQSFRYGPTNSNFLPIAGDWDGDGIDTVGLYNSTSGVFFLNNSHSGGIADLAYRYGPAGAGWAPLAEDWNGDSIDTPGLYSPNSGYFFLKNSHRSGIADLTYRFGPLGLEWLPLGTSWKFPSSPSSEQLAILQVVNDARASGKDCGTRGVFGTTTPLIWNDMLGDAAQRLSDDMAQEDFFSHTGSDGSSVGTRVSDAGYDWWIVGENIAAGYPSVESVVNGWLNSDGHCANIMNPNFDEFGSAKSEDSSSTYGIYWTQVFAEPQ